MQNSVPSVNRIFWSWSCKWIVSILWIIGLFFGSYTAAGADSTLFSLMRGWDGPFVSIVGLLITFLPFLFTAVAVYLSAPTLLLATVLVKAFLYGYCLAGMVLAYGDAAWLIQFLFLFSDSCCVGLLMWLWLRCGSSGTAFFTEFLVCFIGALGLIILDFCAVSPFAAYLL